MFHVLSQFTILLYQNKDHKTHYNMKTIKEIYRIGKGPSSSHTMGPRNAALEFIKHHPDANLYQEIGRAHV